MKQKKKEKKSSSTRLNPMIPVMGILLVIMLGVLVYGAKGLSQTEASSSSASPSSAATAKNPSLSSAAPEAAAGVRKTSGSETSSANSSGDEYVLPSASSQTTSSSSSSAPSSRLELFSSSVSPASKVSPEPGLTEEESGSKISREEYDALKEGMSLDDVIETVGVKGTLENEIGDTRIYRWDGWGSSGAWVKLTFKKEKLTKKYQFGL